MIKGYRCKFEKQETWTSRKDARKCVQSHIKTDKETRAKKREDSNISENTITKEFE